MGAIIEALLGPLSFCLLIASAATVKDCDKSKCTGPIRYYEDLRCRAIYQEPDDCCPIRYDCSDIEQRSDEKCYASNGREYSDGEFLRKEDNVNPCDIGCICTKRPGEPARFSCAIVDCWPKQIKPGCYWRGKMDACCGGEEICPENSDERMKCKVDDHDYLDGERFFPDNRTDLLCQCMPGYEGKYEAPYCRNITCGLGRMQSTDLKRKCAPVYINNRSPRDSCSTKFRCQNENDTVIRSGSGSEKDPVNVCDFGDLKLRVGDQLSPTDTLPFCIKCTCELPPLVTCEEIPYQQCEN